MKQCQLPKNMGGIDGTAAYLNCGEGEFPIRRLSQIAQDLENRTSTNANSFLSNVHIEQCYTIDDIEYTLVSFILFT